MNLEPEERNGYFISAEMKKVWAVEMQLLKKLLEVCEKHHLKVWAEGGTLLGTVREHGYIPWDDDIDMAMMRDDYDKLQTIAKDEFQSPFFFQSGYTDLFPNGITRLRMDGTAAIFYRSIYHNYHQGIFIDIFPLDAISDNDELFRQVLIKKTKQQQKLLLYFNHYSFTNLKYNWNLFKAKLEVKRMGFHTFFSDYDSLVKQFSKEPHRRVSFFSWIYDKKYLREENWYSDTIYMEFENIMIPVPLHYDKILTTQYGNYMKPVKSSTMHGDFIVLDAERSYSEYIEDLRKKYKWSAIKHWQKKIGLKLKDFLFWMR